MKRKCKNVNVCLAMALGGGVGSAAVVLLRLAMVLGTNMGTTAMAWDCATNIPAQCHYADTNPYPMVPPLPNWWIITSDGFSTKCINADATNGPKQCVSVTNDCVYQEWMRKSDGTDLLPRINRTNKFDTTTGSGDCVPPG